MATQYIKYAKKCRKNFFSKIIGGGHGPFWPGGGYAHGVDANPLILFTTVSSIRNQKNF